MRNKLEFISLFSGAGGLDIGFELAGWNCLYASDIDKFSVETLRANQGTVVGQTTMLSETVIEQADVRNLSGKEILEKVGRKQGEIPLLVGGPPCQSWSSAGHQLGFEDPRGQLFRDYVRIAVDTGVRWIIFENVRGLLTARGADGKPGSALEHIRTILLEAGFQTEVELLNAADFGVAQRRVRLILIGYRAGDKPPFPIPSHSKSPLDDSTTSWATLQKCLNSISPLTEEEIIRPNDTLAKQLELIPPGSGVKSPGKRETTRPGGHWGYKQGAFIADTTAPARTVTASAQQDWIKDTQLGLRRLCPRECAAIQSFPDTWKFIGKRTDAYRQIGNAVPPLLAFKIAAALRSHIENAPMDEQADAPLRHEKLSPLKKNLISAVHYTIKEERRNGESRRSVAPRRISRILDRGELNDSGQS
jgi:DNA (cytosine-5)-methyltransferase 1